MFGWKKTIMLVRGLPGSGKSTLALKLVNGNQDQVVENDDYWLLPVGTPMSARCLFALAQDCANFPEDAYELKDEQPLLTYEYHPEMVVLAAYWCGAEAFRRLLRYDCVAVANCFVKREYILPWIDECRRLQVRVELHHAASPWAKNPEGCLKHNVHNIPPEKLAKMAAQWEEISQEEIDKLLGQPAK